MIALFDLDGVIVDSETQYSRFWDKIGMEHFGRENFGMEIKGQTLEKMLELFECDTRGIVKELEEFESCMSYDYIPGALEFIKGLKAAGIPVAIVTSSSRSKMQYVREIHPELWELTDAVLMSGDFSRSKPDPECFLKGMEVLGGKPEETYVFEDSIHGIKAGLSAGATVIGLATTYKREDISPLCHKVIDDFIGFSLTE